MSILLWEFAENDLRRKSICSILLMIAGGNREGKTSAELSTKKETGLRCGGRGKSEISSAL
jgi:hypothetical protein